jgi:hypothetical protein
MSSQTLILPVKRLYFEAIKTGGKAFEYRLITRYWSKRLEGKNYKNIVITLGYPKSNDKSRRLGFKWTGYDIKTITHPHFGSEPVNVYAIRLNNEAAE